MRKSISIATLACAPFLACGGDSNNKTIHTVDAKVFKDGPPAVCTAQSAYNGVSLGSNQGEYYTPTNGSSDPIQEMDALLNMDAMPDAIHLLLYEGYGAFAGSGSAGYVKTGTFTIQGDELDFAKCGVCAFISTDIHMQGSGFADTDVYFATGGSLTLTAVGAGSNGSGTLAGHLDGVSFVHVSDPTLATTTPAGDGCMSAIDTLAFSGVLMPPFQRDVAGRAVTEVVLKRRHF
jgi:hypothetical protein